MPQHQNPDDSEALLQLQNDAPTASKVKKAQRASASTTSPSTSFQDPLNQPLGAADQACKECRRRKSKCNRGMPTCDLCIKYNRHCLYEKHSKTPLTRKHLTEVEERLERAETLLIQARLIPPAKRPIANIPIAIPRDSTPLTPHDAFNSKFDFSNLQNPIPGLPHETTSPDPMMYQESPILNSFNQLNSHVVPTPFQNAPRTEESPDSLEVVGHQGDSAITTDTEAQSTPNPLECPPMDDFEWDEQYVSVIESNDQDFSSWASKSSEAAETDENVVDGMASLTVDEKEGGYLGVASGAALLRIIDPLPLARKKPTSSRPRLERFSTGSAAPNSQFYHMPNPNRHILDSMIDSYFKLYHLSYPIVHEPTFRAQYSEVIPRPNGDCWLILAYVIAALGVYTTSTSLGGTDLPLFAQAKSMLSINFLEAGNLTLVQALTLISNYQQKRNKPNSGYNYLGLAVRMAMGLGLHKEFQGWNISPLKMEIRRRVWWSLCVFDVGATITFSRPMAWPGEGIEVAFPMNVNDRDLTMASTTYPEESNEITPYTAVRTQAAFHMATNRIYARVISKPFPTAKELLHLDDTLIGNWLSNLSLYFTQHAFIPRKYSFAHAVMMWRYRNLRIIMYRPFVIRKALYARNRRTDESPESFQAYERCLDEARSTIASIREFWEGGERNRLTAWYALYFLFQAVLIPCICLRNSPTSPEASHWRTQILTTLSIISSLTSVNSSSPRCHQVIMKLCGQYLQNENQDAGGEGGLVNGEGGEDGTGGMVGGLSPINESPQTQMNNVYSMMWPNVPALEADVVMQDDAWMEFLRGEDPDFGNFGGELHHGV